MSETYSPLGLPTRRTRILLVAVWAVLTAFDILFVFVCAPNAPAVDEWEFVAVLVGKEPAIPWLWAQHNEHRLPLARLLYLAEFRLTRDFRAAMLIQVAIVSGLCLGLMRLAASLRGRPDWADLFFPVSLLHLGHWENFLLGYQLCFALHLLFTTGLVVVALRARRETAFRSGVLGGVLLLAVALTGGSGLALVPPVAAWLLFLAAVTARTDSKRRALVVAALALASVLYLAAYFVGYERPANHPPPSTDPARVADVTGKVLAMALGVGVSGVWWVVAAAMIVLGATTIALLIGRGVDPAERPASVGLIAVAAGVAGIAVAIGVGRAGFGSEMGLWSRYSFLVWPLLGAAYLVWVKSGRRAVPICLCAAAALAFPTNTGSGIVRALGIVAVDSALEADVRAGKPDDEIIAHHFPTTRNDGQQARAAWAIPMLRAADIGLFSPDGSGKSALWWVAIQVAVLGVGGWWLWTMGRAVQAERARELFRLQHERFEEQVIAAGAATGLPRGLTWTACAITGDAVLVRDQVNGGIVALVPVVINFEPVAGSDMEDIPAAREPRPATAVFTFRRGTWETTGKVVFNHTPDQTVAKFAPQFRVIHHGHH
jgi:hypothetical protein